MSVFLHLQSVYLSQTMRFSIQEVLKQVLQKVDVIIDGPFIENLKDLSLKFRGSSNQHIRVKKNNAWEIEE